jgi:trehalose-phosphatase
VPSKLYESEPGPSPLPPNLLSCLVQRKPILLCLDYDGTISEIAAEPHMARPVSGALEALRSLAAYRGRVTTALITGRTVEDLRSLLPLPRGVIVAGVHGLQLTDETGKTELACGTEECREDLQRARLWLEQHLPANSGFIVEDKGVALTLHYRQAAVPLAHQVRDPFEQFISHRTASLRARHGKMVIEALPLTATKATAVRTLWHRVGPEFEPVYFGDDLADEDAFSELAADGISVLVGEPRRSAARYRVNGPSVVVQLLNALAATLETRTR